jgi:hypothetical protein
MNKINLSDLLQIRKFDRDKIPTKQHISFTIQGKCIAQLGSYCVISGLPKSSKSTYLASAIASAYLPAFQDNWGMKFHLPDGRNKICYFDTESSEYDFYQQIEKIKKFSLTSNLHPDIDCFNTREDSPELIRALIMEYLKNNSDCSILCIDGFLDLCFNYNDEVETRKLTNWFKKITKEFNIMLLGVLHLGKSGGHETLGHLGSNTDRWANSTLIVEKNKDNKQYVLKPKFLRSSSDFDPIAITNIDGAWFQQSYLHTEIQLPNKKQKK